MKVQNHTNSLRGGSDFIAEAMVAADPDKARKALEALSARDLDPTVRSRNAVLLSCCAEGKVSSVQAQSQTLPARGTRLHSLGQQFEQVVLNVLISQMLPHDTDLAFGKGLAGETWRSFLSSAIADTVAAKGGLKLDLHLPKSSAT